MVKKKKASSVIYQINESKNTVTCIIYSKGQEFIGMSRCTDSDDFDQEKGMKLAYYRADLKLREYDLEQTRALLFTLQSGIETMGEGRSRLWNSFYQKAIKTERSQRKHINYQKRKVAKYIKTL